MNPLLMALLKNIIVPELTTFIHDHYNKTGELPTEEQLQRLIDDKAAQIVLKGEALIKEIQGESDGTV